MAERLTSIEDIKTILGVPAKEAAYQQITGYPRQDWYLANLLLAAATMLPGLAPIFAGRKAKTANLPAKVSAVGEIGVGRMTPKQGLVKFGWFKGPEGKWRFEIDDSAMRMKPVQWRVPTKTMQGDVIQAVKRHRLEDVIDHPELFAAYPELKDIIVDYKSPRSGGRFTGSTIEFDGTEDTLIHEIQHAVQEIEGFGRGGNKGQFTQDEIGYKSAVENIQWEEAQQRLYEELPGEIEAREAASRRKLTPEEHRKMRPKKVMK